MSDLQSASQNPAIDWIIVTFTTLFTLPLTNAGLGPVDYYERHLPYIFDQYGVDMVLQGHVHNYQRTYPLKYNPSSPSNPIRTSSSSNTYNDPEGEIFAIVGTGGNSFHSLSGKSSFVVSQQDDTIRIFGYQYHNNGATLEGKYYLDSGSLSDQFTITKTIPPFSAKDLTQLAVLQMFQLPLSLQSLLAK